MHLAVLVLQEVAERPVQHARRAARKRRRMTLCVESLARCLDAHQLDFAIRHECVKDSHRVRSAADAGHHGCRQPARALENLRSRFRADHRLQVTHNTWIGSRPDHRADDVVAISHVRYPVANCFARGILQRLRPRRHRTHFRAHEPHPEDVQRLSPHVFLAHVDHALETEPGAHGCCRYPVLACTGLGDDPSLAHPPGEQRLSDGVVDFVGARVVEIFPLEVHGGSNQLGEARRITQRGWTTDVGTEQIVQLGSEAGVRHGAIVLLLQLIERRDQRLGDISAAEHAKPVLSFRYRHARWVSRSTARANSRIRSGSLMPRVRSMPDDTSTTSGWNVRMACATLSGVRPPATMNVLSCGRASAGSALQSNAVPDPPTLPATAASSRMPSATPSNSAIDRAASSPLVTRTTAQTAVDDSSLSRASRTVTGDGSPCNCATSNRRRRERSTISSTVCEPNTAARLMPADSASSTSAARAASSRRGPFARTTPAYVPPCGPTSAESPGRVRPQNLISTATFPPWHRGERAHRSRRIRRGRNARPDE